MNTLRSLLFILGVCVLATLGWRLTTPPPTLAPEAVPVIRAEARRDEAAAPAAVLPPSPPAPSMTPAAPPSPAVPDTALEDRTTTKPASTLPPSAVPPPGAGAPAMPAPATQTLAKAEPTRPPPVSVVAPAPVTTSAMTPATVVAPVPAVPPPSDTAPAASLAALPPDPRRDVERRMADVPQYAAFFGRLDGLFPHVQDHLVDQWVADRARDGSIASPDTMVWQAVRDIQQTRGVLARRASDEALTAYFDARLAVLDAMAPTDPKLCADFLYGGADGAMDAFSSAHHDLVAEYASRQLAALASGRDRHDDPAMPTASDLDRVAQGLAAKGLTSDEVAMLLDGKALDPPPSDARLCDLGRLYLTVLRALPPESRQRVYGLAAELLARS